MIVIFDLDGTLVDTYPIIRKTLIEVFDKHLPALDYDEELLMSFFGPTLSESFNKLTKDSDQTESLIKEYRKININYYENELTLFPKVKESLEKIKEKHQLAILSNRVKKFVDVALKKTEIDHYFDIVLGVDNLKEPKPNPDGIYQIIDHYKVEKEKVVFIGDALSDIITAKNAGVISIGVTWALTKKEEFEKVKPDYIINNFDELTEVLEEINV